MNANKIIREARLDIVRKIHGMNPTDLDRMCSLEHTEELNRWKDIAIEEQCFETAARLKNIIVMRGAPLGLKPVQGDKAPAASYIEQIEQLFSIERQNAIEHYIKTCVQTHEYEKVIADLRAEIDLNNMRMAAVMTACTQNTWASQKDRIGRGHAYWTQCYGDVCAAIDREILLRQERDKLAGYYDSIVKTIGHDQILKAYDVQGKLLMSETKRRRTAEEALCRIEQHLKSLNLPVPPADAAFESQQVYDIDQLSQILKEKVGEDFIVTQKEKMSGDAEAVLTIEGKIRATWKARLVKIPPPDGVTPRGPSEYFELKFYPE